MARVTAMQEIIYDAWASAGISGSNTDVQQTLGLIRGGEGELLPFFVM